MLCCSLPYKQRSEELMLEIRGLHDEHESMTAIVSKLQAALQGHHQVNNFRVVRSLLYMTAI